MCSAKSFSSEKFQTHLVTLDVLTQLPSGIKTKAQICHFISHQLVSYLDLVYYVKECKLMLIREVDIINNLVQVHKKSIVSISSEIYAKLSLGQEYTYEIYFLDFLKNLIKDKKSICKLYEKKVVTSDNRSFYFIENCLKRSFDKYQYVDLFLKESKPIFFVSTQILKLFPNGVPIKLSVQNKVKKTHVEMKENLPPQKLLCAKLEHKVVSFYEGFFLVENCQLYRIDDFNLEIQRKADLLGGVQELSLEQALGLPEVGIVKDKDVLRRMR